MSAKKATNRFAMKAAAGSKRQLADRIKKFSQLGLSPFIELHLTGLEDIYENSSSVAGICLDQKPCEYVVHYPISDVKRQYVFDMFNDEEKNIEKALEFCRKIDAKSLIVHRCFGFGRGLAKNEAGDKLFGKLGALNNLGEKKGVSILFENYGFAWLPEGFGREFVSSPLDHFFPWEIADFNERKKRSGLDNIDIVLDVAHANLSCNMFNMLKRHPELRSDERFVNIYDSDLRQCEQLRSEHFIFGFIDYFHVSDSLTWDKKEGLSELDKYLHTEGLPIGRGSIDYRNIFKNIGKGKTIVVEINPEAGDNDDNMSQLEAIEKLRAFL